jgi:hypothetical protein
MKRISTSTRVVDKFGAGKDGFTDGNPSLGLYATDMEADFYDHVQEEICSVIEATGGTPDGSSRAQLLAAIQALASIPAGTKMLFQQTAAPVGWTKDLTHDNKALRVVNGVAGSGGTVDFTTAFASKAVSGTVGSTTLTTSQMPSHNHQQTVHNASGTAVMSYRVNSAAGSDPGGNYTQSTGGGGSHTHSFSGTAIDLAVQYVDLIIATKD